jgi:PAS domain S-box-containing protein
VLQVAVVRISELFSIERVTVVIFDHAAKLGFVVMEREQQLLENVVIQIEDYPELQQVIARREPLLIPDVFGDALLAGVRGKLETAQQQHRGAVLLPLTRRDHVVGALFLRSKELLAEVDIDLVAMGRLIANITAVAIGHALEHDELLSETKALQRSKAWADEQLAGLKELREFLDQAKDGMLVTDVEGRITYANATAASILRQELRALSGERFLGLLQPHCHSLAERALAGEPVGDENGYVDLVVGRADESPAAVVISAAIRPSQNPEGVFISFRDVTGLREIESELRQTKEFLENLIQSSVDAIIATDTDGRVILFNRAAENMLGYAAQEIVGRANMSVFYPRGESWDVLRKLRSEAYGGRGRLQMVRKELLAKGGDAVPVNLTAAIIYEGNREVATVSILSDLRERRRIEEKLSQVQRRLQLTERQAVAVELAGVAAHELNQPLTSIFGYAEMLRRRLPEDDPNRKAVITICQEAERMASIVRKIGQITAYQTKPYVGSSQILDIGEDDENEPPKEGQE